MKSLLGEKLAVLAGNGFCEKDFFYTQRALEPTGVSFRMISTEQSLIKSWNGSDWGQHYACDQSLGTALAADFSMLFIPGGRRSIEKLKLTAHTKRFINGFLESNKAVVVLNEAVELIVNTSFVKGRSLSGPENIKNVMRSLGIFYSPSPISIDANLLTAITKTPLSSGRTFDAIKDHILSHEALAHLRFPPLQIVKSNI